PGSPPPRARPPPPQRRGRVPTTTRPPRGASSGSGIGAVLAALVLGLAVEDPPPALVDPAFEVVQRTGVVDDEVGAGEALLPAGLVADAGPGIGLVEVAEAHEALHRQLRVDIHHDHPGEIVASRLDQQGDVE